MPNLTILKERKTTNAEEQQSLARGPANNGINWPPGAAAQRGKEARSFVPLPSQTLLSYLRKKFAPASAPGGRCARGAPRCPLSALPPGAAPRAESQRRRKAPPARHPAGGAEFPGTGLQSGTKPTDGSPLGRASQRDELLMGGSAPQGSAERRAALSPPRRVRSHAGSALRPMPRRSRPRDYWNSPPLPQPRNFAK